MKTISPACGLGLSLVGLVLWVLSADSHAQSRQPAYAVENRVGFHASTLETSPLESSTGGNAAVDHGDAEPKWQQPLGLRPAVPPTHSDPDVEQDTVQIQIVGGQPATPGAYPFQVLLYIENSVCGGTLISPDWVLTAAHCSTAASGATRPPQAFTALLGKFDRGSPELLQQSRSIDAVFVHPNYNSATEDNDVALLRLRGPAVLNERIATVDRIRLPAQNSLQATGVAATVIGWGATRYQGATVGLLHEVQFPIVSQAVCIQAYQDLRWPITDNMLCAGPPDGAQDSCQGDSGGPLLVNDSAGGWLQAGITSFGFRCAEPGYYGVYTRIGQVNGWIDQVLAAHTPAPDLLNVPTGSIANGDFSLGPNNDWQEESASFEDSLILLAPDLPGDALLPFTGIYAAWLGGGNDETARLSQTIEFDALATVLRYQYWIDSIDSCGFDQAWVSIGDTIIDTYALCMAQNTFGWHEGEIDVRPYRNTTQTLAFHLETNSTDYSSLFLDNVRLYREAKPLPRLVISGTVARPQPGIATQAVVTVTLDEASELPVTVQFATLGNTAEPGIDYAEKNIQLSFAPGETEQTVTIDILNTPLVGQQKTFGVGLQNAVNAQIQTAQAQVVILGPPLPDPIAPEISIADLTVAVPLTPTEPAELFPAYFKAWLSHSTPHTVTVGYTTQDGTAVAPRDYLSRTGTLVFPPGTITRTLPITLVGMTTEMSATLGTEMVGIETVGMETVEPAPQITRTFSVSLSNPLEATLLRPEATGTIRYGDFHPDEPEPDFWPLVSVADGKLSGEAPDVRMSFEVSLSAASALTVVMSYSTFDGSATAPEHYIGASGVLTFAPGTLTQTVEINVLGNKTPRPSITFTLVLSEPIHAHIGSGTGVGILFNPDAKKPTIDSFTPLSGKPGTIVTVEGSHFTHILGVYVGGISASFRILSDTRVEIEIPPNAVDGTIVIETAAGLVESAEEFTLPKLYQIYTPQLSH